MNTDKTLRLIRLALLAGMMTMAASGCLVVSINTWLNTEEATLTPSLAGNWTNKVENAMFVALPEGKAYCLTLTTTGEKPPMRYQCTLHSIGDELLLQVGPDVESIQSPGALLPAYMLFRLDLTATAMKIYPIERNAFETRAKTGQLSIAAVTESSRGNEPVIVTSLPEELKKFIASNLKDKTFFSGKPTYSFTKVESNTTTAVETTK